MLQVAKGVGGHVAQADLDANMDAISGPPIRTYYLRIEIESHDKEAAASVGDIVIESDLQMSSASLPKRSGHLERLEQHLEL